ncbi:hypothetical protein CYMTET_49821 [Cymbomonas tetramitiformis]|uniref:Double-stranded RNA-specific adenosine deaminase n=1 Tax=Cymbomonas tetramitiformis TaxID=36881 RepID=A0AAE0BPF6_9CHLO|nr:hypothetical protein CYMTET_49821 [Cymbomonas tetramitiformis]
MAEAESITLQRVVTELEKAPDTGILLSELCKAVDQERKKVNGLLYALQDRGLAVKVRVAPPSWRSAHRPSGGELPLIGAPTAAVSPQHSEGRFLASLEGPLGGLQLTVLRDLEQAGGMVDTVKLWKTVCRTSASTVTKKEVNAALYALQERGLATKAQESPPRWNIASKGREHILNKGPNHVEVVGTSADVGISDKEAVEKAGAGSGHRREARRCVSELNEYAQKLGLPNPQYLQERDASVPAAKRIRVKIGARFFEPASGNEAAAANALSHIHSEAAVVPYDAFAHEEKYVQLDAMYTPAFFDKVGRLSEMRFHSLARDLPGGSECALGSNKVIAAFVLVRSDAAAGRADMEVVSVASGNRVVTGDALSCGGEVVNDCHAEILARRGFLRYCYRHLREDPTAPGALDEAIFTASGQLLPHVSVHLYVSKAPCGDSCTFFAGGSTPEQMPNSGGHAPLLGDHRYGRLSVKVEKGEGTVPNSHDTTEPTLDGVRAGERLRTASCSDKVMRWNVLGVQGALLSHLVAAPLYLSSVTIGRDFHPGHLARALCCRLEQSLISEQLPKGYRVHHPHIGVYTARSEEQRCVQTTKRKKSSEAALTWIVGDTVPEVLDGTTGRESFKNLRYVEAKQQAAAPAFQQSKSLLFDHLDRQGLGKWIHKPAEVDDFKL